MLVAHMYAGFKPAIMRRKASSSNANCCRTSSPVRHLHVRGRHSFTCKVKPIAFRHCQCFDVIKRCPLWYVPWLAVNDVMRQPAWKLAFRWCGWWVPAATLGGAMVGACMLTISSAPAATITLHTRYTGHERTSDDNVRVRSFGELVLVPSGHTPFLYHRTRLKLEHRHQRVDPAVV
jgi:hypothetical protein